MAFVHGYSPRRVVVALVVFGIHALIVFALVRATLLPEAPHETVPSEHISWLNAAPKPPVPHAAPSGPVAPPIVPVPRPLRLPSFTFPGTAELPATPAAPSSEALKGVHLNLFHCALENLANLPPDEREQCEVTLKKYDDKSVDYADRTNRSKSAKLWARRLAKKQNPLLLPCMSPQIASPIYTLYCLTKGVLKGFDLDEMPGYADVPKTVDHLPNNGDPQHPAEH